MAGRVVRRQSLNPQLLPMDTDGVVPNSLDYNFCKFDFDPFKFRFLTTNIYNFQNSSF